MIFAGSVLLHLPKAIFHGFFRIAQPQQPTLPPLTESQITELECKVALRLATETTPEFLPANARPLEGKWENSPSCAMKSLRRKAAEIRCEAVYNVTQQSRSYYEDGRFFPIYRACGVV